MSTETVVRAVFYTVGQRVYVVTAGYGRARDTLAPGTVERVKPTRVTISSPAFNGTRMFKHEARGSEIGADKWARTHVVPSTPGLDAAYADQQERRRCLARIERTLWRELPTLALQAVDAALENNA